MRVETVRGAMAVDGPGTTLNPGGKLLKAQFSHE